MLIFDFQNCYTPYLSDGFCCFFIYAMLYPLLKLCKAKSGVATVIRRDVEVAMIIMENHYNPIVKFTSGLRRMRTCTVYCLARAHHSS
jgi:hypothetical protein